MGRKIGHHIKYDDRLSLQPVMSEGQYGPCYSLYGVICHAGGGPNSGHYYAYVKASDGIWYEMNDDFVASHRSAPVGLKSAYILFYIRDKGQVLKAAVATASSLAPIPQRNGVVAGMKKRKTTPPDEEDGEDIGIKATRPFIGPQLPSQRDVLRSTSNSSDPQANLVKRKIEAASKKPVSALSVLSQYGEESDESGSERCNTATSDKNNVSSSPLSLPPTSSPAPATSRTPISPSTFYGTPKNRYSFDGNARKRKSPEGERDENLRDYARTPLRIDTSRPHRAANGPSNGKPYHGNPYRFSGCDNLRAPPTKTYKKRHPRV